MKTKLLFALLGAFGAGVVGSHAQTPAPAPAPTSSSTWTLTGSYASQYMFRGVRLGGPSFQPSVEYGNGGIVAGVWANFPLAKKVPGQSDPEFDFYGSYTETINSNLNFVTGATLYYYPDAEKKNGFYKWTFEPNLAVNYTVSGIKLTPKIYFDTMLNGPTAEFSAAYAVPLKDAGTELDFVGTVGTYKWTTAAESTTPDVKNTGDYWLVGVSAPFQLTSNSKLTVGAAYTKGSNNYFKSGTTPKVRNPAAVGRGVFTVSYAVSF